MRNSVLILAIVVGLGSIATSPAAPKALISAEQLAQLVQQLGSASFREREAATQALEAIGGPALQILQQATLSSDPEIGRRAQNLAATIRRRLENAHFLAPLRLRLVYKETPVLQALEDFAHRSQFPIDVVGSKARLTNRTITLDTGATSFWEAFDRFCQGAGLMERIAPAETALEMRLDIVGGRPLGIPQLVEATTVLNSARSWDGHLVLVDGRLPVLPTCHAGSVRVRALPVGVALAHPMSGTLFVLEITPQPKLAWKNVIDLRIDKAVTEDDQDVAAALDVPSDIMRTVVPVNGGRAWDAQPPAPPRDFPVCFKSTDRPPRLLKELRGVVAAQVQTPPQVLIAVDNIFKSVGRTLLSDDGESLKVVEAKRQANGDVEVRIELHDASAANALWVVRRGGVLGPNRGGRGGRGRPLAVDGPPANLVLQDAQGHVFAERSRGEIINSNTLMREISLTYEGGGGLGEPQKLIYSGQRTIMLEVPFTLKDVPLS